MIPMNLRLSGRLLSGAALAVAALLFAPPAHAAPLDAAGMKKALETIDYRQRNSGDYKSLVYLEQKQKDKTDVVQEAFVYRRDADEKLMILFSKPKTDQGTGYLRLEKNLWFYDPTTGKWERRTERERIGGTDSRRADFDQSKLAVEYDPAYEAEQKLGAYQTHVLKLTSKPDIDVAFPVVKLWVDQDSGNVLKRQEFALSGKLMRTVYYPKWKKLYSESKKADVWFPEEIRIFDEIEKSNSTLVLIKSVDLRPLDANMFTKAWLESKSR
jgi:hypothetical protein